MKFTSAASSTSCTGSITVAYGNLSDTANVFYTEPVYDSYTYIVKASDTNTSGTPTITINDQNATITHSDGYYIGKITISDSSTTSAPDRVSWSISGGTKNTEWGSYNISLSPDSWNLDDSLTNEFNVALIQSGTRYDWSTTSGTVAKNRDVSTDVTSSPTSYTGSEYSVSGPSGMTFSKNGTSFTATASSTGNTGTITVTCTESDANGESATCNVIYNPALKNWTYTVNATCSERPTITIDGEDATITGEINAWVGTRIIVAQEDPGEKNYYVTSGSSSRTWTNVHVSVEPSSINITEKPKDISFTAYAYQEYEEYSAYTASGTTSNKRAACKPTRDVSYGTSSSETCDISASNVSGLSGSMSISKYGTTVSGTASDSGYVTVSYNYGGYSDSATCNITYEEQEIWPSWDDPSVTYTFQWSNMTESISANDIAYNLSNDAEYHMYKSATVNSYRTRTSSKGNTENQDVGYTGKEKGWPSGNNTSTSSRSDSGTLTQNNSGKTITWSWSQDGKPQYKFYAETSDSTQNVGLWFDYNADGTESSDYPPRDYTIVSKVGDKDIGYTQSTEGSDSGASGYNYSESDIIFKKITYTQNESGETIHVYWRKKANYSYKKQVQSTINITFPKQGGTKNVELQVGKYWRWAESGVNPYQVTKYTKTITAQKNNTSSTKYWTETYEEEGLVFDVHCTQS